MTIRLCALLATLALAAGCTPETPQESPAPAAGTAAVPAPAPEPAAVIESAEAPLAAIVLGEEIRSSDAGEMQQVALTHLFDRYAADHGIEVTDEEVGAWVERMQRAMAEDPNLDAEDGLTPEEATQVKEMRREMGRSMIRQWKLNRALYEQYGGRVIY